MKKGGFILKKRKINKSDFSKKKKESTEEAQERESK